MSYHAHAGHCSWLIALKTVAPRRLTVSRARVITTRVTPLPRRRKKFVKRAEGQEWRRVGGGRGERLHTGAV